MLRVSKIAIPSPIGAPVLPPTGTPLPMGGPPGPGGSGGSANMLIIKRGKKINCVINNHLKYNFFILKLLGANTN
jgi:hypothetical protein